MLDVLTLYYELEQGSQLIFNVSSLLVAEVEGESEIEGSQASSSSSSEEESSFDMRKGESISLE